MDNIEADEIMDARGLSCPMLLLKAWKTINFIDPWFRSGYHQ
jgi:TusA-related sulfurtransferase